MKGIVNKGFYSTSESHPRRVGEDPAQSPQQDGEYRSAEMIGDSIYLQDVITIEEDNKEGGKENRKQEKEEKEEKEKEQEEEEEEEEEDEGNYGILSYLDPYLESDAQIPRLIRRLKQDQILQDFLSICVPLTTFLLYLAYLISVIVIHSRIQDSNYWCHGDGFLYLLTGLVFTGIFYSQVKVHCGPFLMSRIFIPLWARMPNLGPRNTRIIKSIIIGAIFVCVVAFYIVDTANQRRRLVSFVGVFFLIGVGFIFSYAPRKVVWRYTIWAISIQFFLALLVLRWPVGNMILKCLSDKVALFLGYANEGSIFVFGELAEEPMSIFAFSVLPVTIFFSFCTNILYYFGVVQWLVIKLGWLFQITVGTSLCESMNAAGSIFLGMTESPLLIKPYLPIMTNSEIHAIMTAGFATIAGSVLAAYIALGADPALLITASVMNAPAALGLSKLMYPNMIKSRINAKIINAIKSDEVNALHAGCVGVSNALPLVAAIAGNLIAFISFIAFFNAVFDWGCQLVNFDEGTCSLEGCFGYIFMPLAWMMGVEWSDCYEVGQLLGLKIVINEFVAYTQLSEFINEGILSDRSINIATFALCGFGNISSVGIIMGGLGPLAPNRKDDMAKIAFRAMLAGSMATFMSACIAGTLIEYDSSPTQNGTTISPFVI